MDRTVLERKSLAELRQIAAALELKGYQRMKKADLAEMIVGAAADRAGASGAEGADDAPPAAPGTDDAPAPASIDDGAGSARPRARPRARRRDEDDGRANGDTGAREDGPGRGERDGGDTPPSGSAPPDASSSSAPPSGPAQGGPPQGGPGSDGGDGGGKRERRRKGGRGNQPHEDLDDAEVREGVLDLLPEGYGFLRVTGYLSGERDVYVSQSFVRRHALRRGDRVAGPIRRNKSNDKFPALARVDAVEGVAFADIDPNAPRPVFDELTATSPSRRLALGATPDASLGVRLLDLFAPVGYGQRGVLVGPPRSGKTTLLTELAAAVRAADDGADVLVVSIDERPEEVTDVARGAGIDVIASTFDRPAEDHTQVAELAIERAKRLAERGRDVIVLLDSLTRLGRAYHVAQPGGSKSPTAAPDASAIYPVERLMAAARDLEDGGSLTVLATASTASGAPADEVVLAEVGPTANLEVHLDAARARARRFPAIDLAESATRREERLLDDDELAATVAVRRALADGHDRLDAVVDRAGAAGTGAALRDALTAS